MYIYIHAMGVIIHTNFDAHLYAYMWMFVNSLVNSFYFFHM